MTARYPLTYEGRKAHWRAQDRAARLTKENTMAANRPALTLTVTGYASADATIKYTPSGQPVANVSVPYTPRRRNQQTGQWEDAGDTVWTRAAVWGDDAEPFADAVRKGVIVTLTGIPRLRSYTTRDGQPGVSLDLTVSGWGVATRGQRTQGGQRQGGSYSAPQGGAADDPWATGAATNEPPF